jgi:hypothetical protein
VVTNAPSPHRWHHRSFRHRAISAGLAVAIVALFFLALLGIVGVPLGKKPKPQETVVFDLPLPAAAAPKADRTRTKTPEKSAAAAPIIAPPAPPVPRPPLPIPPKPTPNMITVSPSEFAALDIGKLKKPGGTSGSGSKGTYGPGEGPGGRALLRADWYVEPRNGELAQYLPSSVPDGSWAMIACRTAPKYHVENCYGLGESSPGLSRALRLASWQFLVVPPRIDGKPQIGAWVRIRFDFSRSGPAASDR